MLTCSLQSYTIYKCNSISDAGFAISVKVNIDPQNFVNFCMFIDKLSKYIFINMGLYYQLLITKYYLTTRCYQVITIFVQFHG